MSYSWVPYEVHVQVELGVETLDSTSEVVLGSPVAPTHLPDCLFWICPAPFSDKITQKSPPSGAARLVKLLSQRQMKLLLTTQKLSLVTKSLENGFDHGLLGRVDFYHLAPS